MNIQLFLFQVDLSWIFGHSDRNLPNAMYLPEYGNIGCDLRGKSIDWAKLKRACPYPQLQGWSLSKLWSRQISVWLGICTSCFMLFLPFQNLPSVDLKIDLYYDHPSQHLMNWFALLYYWHTQGHLHLMKNLVSMILSKGQISKGNTVEFMGEDIFLEPFKRHPLIVVSYLTPISFLSQTWAPFISCLMGYGNI